MTKKIAVIFGDGIGPEVTHQSLKVLDGIARQFKHSFKYSYSLMGADAINKTGSPLPDETLENCLASDAILFGAIGDPKYDNDPTAKVRPEQGLLKLRKSLGLYANIRPVTIRAFAELKNDDSSVVFDLREVQKVLPGAEILIPDNRVVYGNLWGFGVAVVPVVGGELKQGNMTLTSYPHPTVFTAPAGGAGAVC